MELWNYAISHEYFGDSPPNPLWGQSPKPQTPKPETRNFETYKNTYARGG